MTLRRCCGQVGGKLELRKIGDGKRKGSDCFKQCAPESKMRTMQGLTQSSAVRPFGEGSGKSNVKRKENGIDSCRSVVCCLKNVSCDSPALCVTPGARLGRRHNFEEENEKDGKSDDLRRQIGENFERRITRSASKRMAGDSDLCRQSTERRSTRTSSKNVAGKADSRKTNKNKQVKSHRLEVQKRIQKESDDLRRQIGENFGRSITRSASKRMAGDSDLCRQSTVRRSTCTSSKNVAGKADSRKTNKNKQVKSHRLELQKRKQKESDDLRGQIGENFERRITRSASKRMARDSDLCRQSTERRSTRTSSKNVAGKADSRKTNKNKQVKSHRLELQKRIQKESVASFSVRLEAEETSMRGIDVKGMDSDVVSLCDKSVGGECKPQDITKGTKLTGVKRKRKQAGLHETDQGWTKDQQQALQRAYFTEKPSPHFWKKVAKLVPGKSAQECFDKVHSDNLTPLSVRRSSSTKKQNSPSDLLSSGSELFKSAEKKHKKTCKTRKKRHMARRTVRHLLQKYSHMNQNSQTDLFSILEPTVNRSAEAIQQNAVQSTPKQLLGSPESSSECRDRSSLGHKIRRSRFSGVRDSPLTSPPVLKKVKNMTLHEKYIDQLHIREGKRAVVSARYLKSLKCQKDGAENPVQMKDAIRAAKAALVSDARDVINKFRDSQANLMEVYSDSEEVLYNDDDDDDDDEAVL